MTDPLANSYYAATVHPWRSSYEIDGDMSFDVAVIGGGFTGLSAALACAERGFSVILIEPVKPPPITATSNDISPSIS